MTLQLCSPQSQWICPGYYHEFAGKDPTLKERMVLSVGDIVLLLEFCLRKTYFSFHGQFYEQVKGVTMGSPVSPIVANLYMKYFDQKALSTEPHPQLMVQVW